jgi:hypothetical protein
VNGFWRLLHELAVLLDTELMARGVPGLEEYSTITVTFNEVSWSRTWGLIVGRIDVWTTDGFASFLAQTGFHAWMGPTELEEIEGAITEREGTP